MRKHFVLRILALAVGMSASLDQGWSQESHTKVSEEMGVVEKATSFWTGHPDQDSSMAFLKVSAGTEVKILGEERDYYKVLHKRLVGYMEKKDVKRMGPGEENVQAALGEEGQDQVSEAAAPANPLYIITKETSLRAEPDSKASVHLRLPQGEQLQVLDDSGRWWWKVDYNGQIGWAKAALLIKVR